MKLSTVATAWGWIGLAVSDGGLVGLMLPQPTEEEAWLRLRTRWRMGICERRFPVDSGGRETSEPVGGRPELGPSIAGARGRYSPLAELALDLREYFEGSVVRFEEKLDLRGHPAFFRHVWDVVRNIPYAEVRTYADVAALVGNPRACRAVGNAMAANPWPIIVPCHRVIKSDGRLGNYADDPGLKARLMELERRALPGRS